MAEGPFYTLALLVGGKQRWGAVWGPMKKCPPVKVGAARGRRSRLFSGGYPSDFLARMEFQ